MPKLPYLDFDQTVLINDIKLIVDIRIYTICGNNKESASLIDPSLLVGLQKNSLKMEQNVVLIETMVRSTARRIAASERFLIDVEWNRVESRAVSSRRNESR